MQTIIVDKSEAGQRFDKYLKRYFKNAQPSLLYKMLRKKNIVLNSKKLQGNEILNEGDVLKIFFSSAALYIAKTVAAFLSDIFESIYLAEFNSCFAKSTSAAEPNTNPFTLLEALCSLSIQNLLL